MQIDFLGMQAFLAIIEQGGFQQAAAHLCLSQTAISHRIRKLEASLGVALLARTTREVTLTDAGRALLPRVRGAIREFELSYDTLRQHSRTAPQWLAFGCLPTLAAHRIAPALLRFREAHPRIAVRVFDNSIQEIAELTHAQTTAFGISVATSNPLHLAVEPFAEEPFVLVCREDHPLAHERVARWAQLQSETLIRISLPAGNATTIDDALGDQRLTLRWAYETQHTAIALDLVRAGLGLTIVPALAVAASEGLVTRPLLQPSISRRLAVLTRRGVTLPEIAQTLRGFLIDALRAGLPAASDESSE
ncbi:LysR family transcriptional regulator [Achromobacter sp. HZ28]|uniref:LysR family transcriptional regulator n=2 Tax=unclassified Achromobacter TaxID=2626865 RepID=UPI000B51555E|nr:LysR substrate-binding domain-containing protein [Achromobacter sp. HZ28]OWT77604.1 transcriptional regulator [Achromobacter sp. HZ28]OWT78652.1 transcriptional regulator [Achromobacter sp. HZ34]